MTTIPDQQAVQAVVDGYPQALETGDADLWGRLFWAEDPEFSVIENDRPHRLGGEYIAFIRGLIEKRGRMPAQRWYDTRIHFVSPTAAYTTSLRDELNTGETSRVTLVLVKRDDQWRILHAHFSCVPK